MSEIILTDESFEKDVLNSDKPVLVDFWAEWCVPCRMLAPILQEIAEEYSEKITVAKLNVDEAPENAAKYNIQSIPTVALFHKGEIVKQSIGVVPKEQLVSLFKDLI
jgi:thioredoxin 1